MNILIILIFIILVFILKTHHFARELFEFQGRRLITIKEYFNFFKDYFTQDTDYSKTNLAALSRNELQSPPTIDLSKIDWSKVDDYTYSQIICLLQECDERPIIKNLPISTSS
jgi:hypothetical protein